MTRSRGSHARNQSSEHTSPSGDLSPQASRACVTKIAAVFLSIFAAAFISVLASPRGQPTLVIEMSSTQSGASQVFFADRGQIFNELDSRTADVDVGHNILRFRLSWLSGALGEALRWDPLDAPAEFTVTKLSVGNSLLSQGISLASLRPSYEVSALDVTQERVSFASFGPDGQLLVEANVLPAYRSALLASLGFAFALSLVVTIVLLALSHFLSPRPRTRRTTCSTTHLASLTASGVLFLLAATFIMSLMSPG